MSKINRGGLTLKSGKIGRVNVLRQQIMMPGERMDMNISGKVRLESLRERDVMRINAHLATFMTPLRWVWPEFPDYVKDGMATAITPPVHQETNGDWSKYGIGTYAPGTPPYSKPMYKWFLDTPLRIYNEWYKWPEDADATSWEDDGNRAVPLSKAWTRCRYKSITSNGPEYLVNSASAFDVRELAEVQAKFRSSMKREVLSYERWMELVNDMWKGDGSREVDQVPIMLDQTEVGVNPRDLPATDGASLGQWQSLYDFGVDHQIKGIIAPEHCIITTMLVVRFPAITDSCHPLASAPGSGPMNWHELVADPEFLSVAEPVPVTAWELLANNSSTNLGYLPAGWQWRADHDVIGKRIYDKNSFPYMDMPTTQAQCKDATRIKDAFRSATLGDYMADIYFQERCRQPIGSSMDSYFAGMIDHTKFQGSTNDEFPKGGKML